jgi:hypothetical protein
VDVIVARNDDYDRLRSGWRRNESGSRPGLGSDVLDLPVGHEWQPGERVAQVGVRIDAAGAATLDDGVALSRLCVSARYAGELPWPAIDDTTRTYDHRAGFHSVSEFITYGMERFLLGYHCDKQFDQPVYLEVLIEKNTLLNITRPVCREYYVPVTSGRGFAGPSPSFATRTIGGPLRPINTRSG